MPIDFAVAAVSGGLDSTVSLAVSLLSYEVKLVLIFNYGQRAFNNELNAVKKICKHYNLSLKQINLDWLEEITDTALVNKTMEIPEYTVESLNSDITILNKSAKAVWVPNRNGVILNIAAAYAEHLKCGFVIFGANSEEAVTFSDNSMEYIIRQNEAFEYSTSNGVKVIAPLANNSKTEIVDIALKNNVPLDMIWSCYYSQDKHCGKCESCNRLKRALQANNLNDIWRKLF